MIFDKSSEAKEFRQRWEGHRDDRSRGQEFKESRQFFQFEVAFSIGFDFATIPTTTQGVGNCAAKAAGS
jgi:hypothetical protein